MHLQINRIFSFAKVINDSIAFHEKVSFQIIDVFISRYRLHKEVYRHPVVVGIELMLSRMLQIISKLDDWKSLFSSCFNGTHDHKWRYITDSVINDIPLRYSKVAEQVSFRDRGFSKAPVDTIDLQRNFSEIAEQDRSLSTDSKLRKELNELHFRLCTRDLFTQIKTKGKKRKKDEKEISSVLGFTSKMDDDPMSKIKFYNDENKLFSIDHDKISFIFSGKVSERKISVYSTKKSKK